MAIIYYLLSLILVTGLSGTVSLQIGDKLLRFLDKEKYSAEDAEIPPFAQVLFTVIIPWILSTFFMTEIGFFLARGMPQEGLAAVMLVVGMAMSAAAGVVWIWNFEKLEKKYKQFVSWRKGKYDDWLEARRLEYEASRVNAAADAKAKREKATLRLVRRRRKFLKAIDAARALIEEESDGHGLFATLQRRLYALIGESRTDRSAVSILFTYYNELERMIGKLEKNIVKLGTGSRVVTRNADVNLATLKEERMRIASLLKSIKDLVENTWDDIMGIKVRARSDQGAAKQILERELLAAYDALATEVERTAQEIIVDHSHDESLNEAMAEIEGLSTLMRRSFPELNPVDAPTTRSFGTKQAESAEADAAANAPSSRRRPVKA